MKLARSKLRIHKFLARNWKAPSSKTQAPCSETKVPKSKTVSSELQNRKMCKIFLMKFGLFIVNDFQIYTNSPLYN